MSKLFDRLQELVPQWRKERAEILKEFGSTEMSTVTVTQAYGGMRGVKGMICETSLVEPDTGLIIQGRPLLDIKDLWPEQTFYLLLTGEIGGDDVKKDMMLEYDKRAQVPDYVWDVLYAMPEDSHPMCMLNTAILVMEKESVFRKWYDKGMTKDQYWIPTLEDSLQLLAKLPGVAAGVYRIRFNKGDLIPYTPGLDWGANYANMLGIAGSGRELRQVDAALSAFPLRPRRWKRQCQHLPHRGIRSVRCVLCRLGRSERPCRSAPRSRQSGVPQLDPRDHGEVRRGSERAGNSGLCLRDAAIPARSFPVTDTRCCV